MYCRGSGRRRGARSLSWRGVLDFLSRGRRSARSWKCHKRTRESSREKRSVIGINQDVSCVQNRVLFPSPRGGVFIVVERGLPGGRERGARGLTPKRAQGAWDISPGRAHSAPGAGLGRARRARPRWQERSAEVARTLGRGGRSGKDARSGWPS